MNEIQQEIPQAPEIETAVLGVLLTDNHCIPENIDKIQIDFDIKSIIGNSTNSEYVDFINYIEKYAVFLNRMKEPLTEEQFIRLVNLKGLKTLRTIVVDLHNNQVYYDKKANTYLSIKEFIERNEKK